MGCSQANRLSGHTRIWPTRRGFCLTQLRWRHLDSQVHKWVVEAPRSATKRPCSFSADIGRSTRKSRHNKRAFPPFTMAICHLAAGVVCSSPLDCDGPHSTQRARGCFLAGISALMSRHAALLEINDLGCRALGHIITHGTPHAPPRTHSSSPAADQDQEDQASNSTMK